jgi:SAM-dependent methyltransferase
MTDTYYLDRRIAAAYDAEHAEMPVTVEDVPFYVGLAKEAAAAGEAVLELGCGTGRVTLPIAAAGCEVVGIDSSPVMLDVARGKAKDASNPRWVEADMTSFSLDQRFGLTIIPFRSFLMLLTVAEQKACLARVRDHLLPGGRLALNIFNPNLVVMGEWLSSRKGSLERRKTGPAQVWAGRDYDTSDQTLTETRYAEEPSDEGATIARVARDLRIRYVFRYEMEHLLALSGFEVEALYGWFDRRPFDRDSDEMVWLARRT